VFRQALRDPVATVREIALHGLACERCRVAELDVADVVSDLVGMLARDPSAEVRHKTVAVLARFVDRDGRARAAIGRAATADPDSAIRRVAQAVADTGQPHVRRRKAALRDVRRTRRAQNRRPQAGMYPFGASCMTASTCPSGSLKKAIHRSWSSILAIRCGPSVKATPRLSSTVTVKAMSAQRK